MKRVILLIPLGLAAINIHAQSIGPTTINATGGTAVIGSNEFDWSIGEMTMVSTFSSPGIVVTQGVLQPAAVTEGIPNISLSKQLRVFPNPASSVVNIEYTCKTPGELSYRLMDVAGRVVSKQTTAVKQGITTRQVDINELACATYMLEVMVSTGTGTPESISYKIQKIK
jgi:ribose/xylose/arabinose/galactoside ABC-type transport system permease subunit